MKPFWIISTDKTAILIHAANGEAARKKHSAEYPGKDQVLTIPAVNNGRGKLMQPTLSGWAFTFPNYDFTPLQQAVNQHADCQA